MQIFLDTTNSKDTVFHMDRSRSETFKLFKETFISSHILVYLDPNKPYTLFTDASKYA